MIEFIQAHGKDLILIITSAVTLASLIVRLTPTQKDDAILGKIVAFLSKYIALNKDAK